MNISDYIFLYYNSTKWDPSKQLVREAAKKSSSLNGRAIKKGEGGKGRAIKEKRTFVAKFQRPLSSGGEGGR